MVLKQSQNCWKSPQLYYNCKGVYIYYISHIHIHNFCAIFTTNIEIFKTIVPAIRDHRSQFRNMSVNCCCRWWKWLKGSFPGLMKLGHLSAKKVQICLKVFGGPKQQSKYWQWHPFPLPQWDKIFNGMWPRGPPMRHQSIICMLLHSSHQKGQCVFYTKHLSTNILT